MGTRNTCRNQLEFLFLTSLWNILDKHTVEIQGSVPPGSVYLKFRDGQNTAYTYLTTEQHSGSFTIFNETYLKRICSTSIYSAE